MGDDNGEGREFHIQPRSGEDRRWVVSGMSDMLSPSRLELGTIRSRDQAHMTDMA